VRASLKALQVLGNTVRGLATANLRCRRVFNAVCLLVLMYGATLIPGGFRTLFRTARREALGEAIHEFTRIFSIRIFSMHTRLTMLTKNPALRLYR